MKTLLFILFTISLFSCEEPFQLTFGDTKESKDAEVIAMHNNFSKALEDQLEQEAVEYLYPECEVINLIEAMVDQWSIDNQNYILFTEIKVLEYSEGIEITEGMTAQVVGFYEVVLKSANSSIEYVISGEFASYVIYHNGRWLIEDLSLKNISKFYALVLN